MAPPSQQSFRFSCLKMYRIRPYSANFAVKPAPIMYHIPSYHQPLSASTLNNDHNNLEKNDMNHVIEREPNFSVICARKIYPPADKREQPDYSGMDDIQRLLALSARLDKFIAEQSKRPKKARPEPEEEWVMEWCDLKPGNSPDIVHAKLTPTTPVFPIHDYREERLRRQYAPQKIQLTLRAVDKPWVKLLNRVLQKRGVQFVEPSQAGTDKQIMKIGVEYTAEDTSKILIKCKEFYCFDVPGIIMLATILGLYSTEDEEVSVKTNKWIDVAFGDTDLDNLSRQLSAYLGANDFLSSQHAILFADLVLRAKFHDSETDELTPWEQIKAANNVQLWAKRIDTSLNTFC